MTEGAGERSAGLALSLKMCLHDSKPSTLRGRGSTKACSWAVSSHCTLSLKLSEHGEDTAGNSRILRSYILSLCPEMLLQLPTILLVNLVP